MGHKVSSVTHAIGHTATSAANSVANTAVTVGDATSGYVKDHSDAFKTAGLITADVAGQAAVVGAGIAASAVCPECTEVIVPLTEAASSGVATATSMPIMLQNLQGVYVPQTNTVYLI